MHLTHGPARIILLAAIALTTAACGPIRLDGRPHIRGKLVDVGTSSMAITHKTGGTYRVEVTPDTKILNPKRPHDTGLCAGRRATVYLVGPHRFTASSITLWDGRCQ